MYAKVRFCVSRRLNTFTFAKLYVIFSKCTSDSERLPALSSIACRYHDLKMYAEALKIHQNELIIKQKLRMSEIEVSDFSGSITMILCQFIISSLQTTKTRLEMFRVRCIGKLASVEQMTAEFEDILKFLPAERIILRVGIVMKFAMALHFVRNVSA